MPELTNTISNAQTLGLTSGGGDLSQTSSDVGSQSQVQSLNDLGAMVPGSLQIAEVAPQ